MFRVGLEARLVFSAFLTLFFAIPRSRNGLWGRFSIFPGTLEHSYRQNNVFGWILGGLGWLLWWGPGIDNFGGFGRFFGPFFANSGAGDWFWEVLGSVFDFSRRPRALLSTKQSVWAGSEWFRVGFVVGSPGPAISPKPCPGPKPLQNGLSRKST